MILKFGIFARHDIFFHKNTVNTIGYGMFAGKRMNGFSARWIRVGRIACFSRESVPPLGFLGHGRRDPKSPGKEPYPFRVDVCAGDGNWLPFRCRGIQVRRAVLAGKGVISWCRSAVRWQQPVCRQARECREDILPAPVPRRHSRREETIPWRVPARVPSGPPAWRR